MLGLGLVTDSNTFRPRSGEEWRVFWNSRENWTLGFSRVKTIEFESLEFRRTLNKSSIWRRMDADTALELVKKGATLLALDVPPYTLFGIDTQVLISHIMWCVWVRVLRFSFLHTHLCVSVQMFSVGPNFKGVKMIPPGIHYIYYSSCNRWPIVNPQCYYSWMLSMSYDYFWALVISFREGSDFSPIIGFFINASSSQVFSLIMFFYLLLVMYI